MLSAREQSQIVVPVPGHSPTSLMAKVINHLLKPLKPSYSRALRVLMHTSLLAA